MSECLVGTIFRKNSVITYTINVGTAQASPISAIGKFVIQAVAADGANPCVVSKSESTRAVYTVAFMATCGLR